MHKRSLAAVLLPLLVLTLGVKGCSPLENQARNAIAGADGFLEQAQKNHLDECKANPSKDFPCGMINRAGAAQNLAIDSLRVYCGYTKATPPNTPCVANKSSAASLRAAIDNLNKIIADYKEAAK